MKRELEHVEITGEHEARERAWQLVSAAFAEHEPAPVRRRAARRLVPAAAVAVAAAIVAAAASPPGRALLRSIRETVGVKAAPALFSLPTGRLLVHSDDGVWIVQADGSKRRLGAYRSASWSPHGLYVAATRRNALYALTPSGEERWSLARPLVRLPVWTGTRTDTRIAYTSRDELRVVGGDGHGDTGLGSAPDLGGAPLAWRPGTTRRVLAYVLPLQQVLRVVDVDAKGEEVWSRNVAPHVSKLEWSQDGRFLLVFAPRGLRVFDAGGRVVAADDPSDGTRDADAVFLPGTHKVAVVRLHGAQSDVFLLRTGQTLFHVAGTLGQVVASPEGEWLLIAWPDADQWIFIRVSGGHRIRAVANVSAQFRSRSFPRVEGWAR